MEQSGEYRIQAARTVVWEALNDAQVLQECIDGCRSVTRCADDQFEAEVTAKIGPVKANFSAEIHLQDLNPPVSYVLEISVKGGVAGFARGRAAVELADDDEATLLTYEVQGNVGGKLAQIGSRLIVAAGRKMADGFFSKFSERWAQ